MTDQGTRLVWESRLARLEAALARDGEEIGRTDAAENLMDTCLVLLLASPRLLNMQETGIAAKISPARFKICETVPTSSGS